MDGGARYRFVVTAACLLALCSCVRPTSIEQFVRTDQAEGGVYRFELDFSDSLATYDISFYSAGSADPGWSCPVKVIWSGPSDQRYTETVYPDWSRRVEKYRSGICMKETGIWTLYLRIDDVPEDFRGIGIICELNGTR